ncbi:MAG: HTH domain-containing protein [Patescibacteria group bacterium]
MSKRRFTPEQIKELLRNQNIDKCSEKAITYAKDFKVKAVQQYEAGQTSAEIFKEAGFDTLVIGKDIPKTCLRGWMKVFRAKGTAGLLIETRGRTGGRPRAKGLSETEKLKRFEAEIAYLKAENEFLRQLRAKRAE